MNLSHARRYAVLIGVIRLNRRLGYVAKSRKDRLYSVASCNVAVKHTKINQAEPTLLPTILVVSGDIARIRHMTFAVVNDEVRPACCMVLYFFYCCHCRSYQ